MIPHWGGGGVWVSHIPLIFGQNILYPFGLYPCFPGVFRISNWNYVQIRHHVYQCFYVTFYKELLKDWGDFEAMSNQESGVEWKNLWGRGRVVIGWEPILASIVNIDNTWRQNVKKNTFESIFSLLAPSIMMN